MLQRALLGLEKAYGPDHCSTLDAVSNLGRLYVEKRQLNKAEQMDLRALAGRKKALEPDHALTLASISHFSMLYLDREDKLDEVEQMLKRVLAGREKALGPIHIETIRSVYRLGWLYRKQGKLDQAAENYTRVLSTDQGSDIKVRWLVVVHGLIKIMAQGVKADRENLPSAKCRLAFFVQHMDKWDQWSHMY